MVVLLAFSSPTSQPPVSTLSTHSHPSIPASSCRSLRFNPSTSLPLPSFVAVRPTRAPTTSVAFHRRHRLAALPFPTLNLAVDEPTTPLASYAVGSPAWIRKRNLRRRSKFVFLPAFLFFSFLPFLRSPSPSFSLVLHLKYFLLLLVYFLSFSLSI